MIKTNDRYERSYRCTPDCQCVPAPFRRGPCTLGSFKLYRVDELWLHANRPAANKAKPRRRFFALSVVLAAAFTASGNIELDDSLMLGVLT